MLSNLPEEPCYGLARVTNSKTYRAKLKLCAFPCKPRDALRPCNRILQQSVAKWLGGDHLRRCATGRIPYLRERDSQYARWLPQSICTSFVLPPLYRAQELP